MKIHKIHPLHGVFQIRSKFNCDDEIDKLQRTRIAEVMKNYRGERARNFYLLQTDFYITTNTTKPQLIASKFILLGAGEIYTDEENELVESIKAKMALVKSDQFSPLDSPDFRVKMSIAHILGETTPSAFLKCEVIIDLSLDECSACIFSNANSRYAKKGDTSETITHEERFHNKHCGDNHYVRDLGFGMRPRQFLTRFIWKRPEDESKKMAIYFRHIGESSLFPEVPQVGLPTFNNFVRGTINGAYFFEPVLSSRISATSMTLVTQVTLGGVVSNVLAHKVGANRVGE